MDSIDTNRLFAPADTDSTTAVPHCEVIIV